MVLDMTGIVFDILHKLKKKKKLSIKNRLANPFKKRESVHFHFLDDTSDLYVG
jgi:hypothetical protein